jgi:cysteine-rich repeat protein
MRARVYNIALALAAALSACNEVGGIAPPILDETVVSCDKDADCVAAVPFCMDVTACEGGFCAFTSASSRACYTGPDGTLGEGACAAGAQTCDADTGEYGPCEGDVLPAAEVCDTAGVDEDCDGQVNEDDVSCTCGDGEPQPWEPCDDGDMDEETCTKQCTLARCGDGVQQITKGEECDDGGTADGDRCSPDCKVQEVVSVAAGLQHTCAVLSGGRLKCWGQNDKGQLGLGNTKGRGLLPGDMGESLPFVDVGGEVIAVTAGECHTCALLSDGAVKCWGCNDKGQLGQGDTVLRGDDPGDMGSALPVVNLGEGQTATALVAGFEHTCAVLKGSGEVKCWGHNNEGQLGLGNNMNRGDNPGEMGDALPAVDLGILGGPTVEIALGREHTCARRKAGQVKCWGKNDTGQLGQGDTADRGDGPLEMGVALFAVDLGFGKLAAGIAAGHFFSCAILLNGAVKCWGRNADGQLGQGDPLDRGDQFGEMGGNLFTIPLGAGRTAVQVEGGLSYTCALLDDMSLKCWGDADAGQLGQGSAAKVGVAPGQMGDSLPPVDLGTDKVPLGVVAGGAHTCAWFKDGSAKCWGANSVGQLGLGKAGNVGNMPDEMGDALPTVKLFSEMW